MIDFRAIALALVLSAPAVAQTYAVSATSYSTSTSFFTPLSGSLQVYRSQSTLERYEGLAGSRLEIVEGTCFGSFIIVRGTPSGGGNCIFTDVNGDQVLQAWNIDQVEQGKGYGTWYFVGGTGAHEGINGRGTYADETDALSGTSKNTITGTVTWPE